MTFKLAAAVVELWRDLADACKFNRGVTEKELADFDKALREWADPNLLYLWTTMRVKAGLEGLAHTLRVRGWDEDPTAADATRPDATSPGEAPPADLYPEDPPKDP